MEFIDTVIITVKGGSGGSTIVNFEGKTKVIRKLYVSYGGNGGDVWLIANKRINTLSHFIFKRTFFAENGQNGYKRGCRGKSGKSLFLQVPLGTRVYDQDQNVIIGDLLHNQTKIMVVKGGKHGFLKSNLYYIKNGLNKSIIPSNRLCRIAHGALGEKRHIRLELLLLADVGVLGLPNTGKSTFVRCVSSAKPKVGDYSFTTLVPSLGVVYIDDNNFVIADIPGVIKGASVGLGLGLSFLKHLKRCRMLLHFVDLAHVNNLKILENIKIIVNELQFYGENLSVKPIWLVFNKIDLLGIEESSKKVNDIISSLKWEGRYYLISSKCNYGIKRLCCELAQFIKCYS